MGCGIVMYLFLFFCVCFERPEGKGRERKGKERKGKERKEIVRIIESSFSSSSFFGWISILYAVAALKGSFGYLA